MEIDRFFVKLAEKAAKNREKIFSVYGTSELLCVMTVSAKNKKEAREKAEKGDLIDIEYDFFQPRYFTGDVEEKNQ